MTKDKGKDKEVVDYNTLLFGDKIKFIDKEYGELVGTVINRWYKPNFYFSVSVKADRRGEKGEDDEDEDAVKYSYKLEGKDKYSNAGYIFHVIPEDIVEVVKKHPSNVERVDKMEKENKIKNGK